MLRRERRQGVSSRPVHFAHRTLSPADVLLEIEQRLVVPLDEHDQVVEDARLPVEGFGLVELQQALHREGMRLAAAVVKLVADLQDDGEQLRERREATQVGMFMPLERC